jgi:hypothetical protein
MSSLKNYQIRQLMDEIQPPESDKQSIVVLDDANTKVVLFMTAASGSDNLPQP